MEQVAGMLDLNAQKARRVEVSAELPDAAGDWRIGLIVGPSGSGKTSGARAPLTAYSVRGSFGEDATMLVGVGRRLRFWLVGVLSWGSR